MTDTIRHYGHWDGNRLVAPSFAQDVKSWPAGTVLELTARKAIKRKTVPQNSFLHLLYRVAADGLTSLGDRWTIAEVKAWMKMLYYPRSEKAGPGGEVIEVMKDTRDLDKEDASVVIDCVIRHFEAEPFCFRMPHPDEQQTMAM